MTTRVILIGVILVLLGCTICGGEPRLTASEATRIAEGKAHSFDAHLDRYTRSPARYEALDHGWWIDYSPKDLRQTPNNGFSVLVRDDTREASIIMPQ